MKNLLITLILIATAAFTTNALAQRKAPNVVFKTSDGKTYDLSKPSGKVVIVNFWATWCEPCRKEIPDFIEFYKSYKDKGVEIIGVSLEREGWEKVTPFLKQTETAPYAGSKTLATTIILFDRLLGLVALFLLAATASVLAAARGLDLPGTSWLWIPPAAALAALVPALRAPEATVRLIRPLERVGGAWLEERLSRLEDALERFGRDPMPLVWTTLAALGVQSLLVLFFLFVAWSLAVPLSLLAAAVVVPVSLAAQMLPLSINGFGVREAVFVFFFTHLGFGLDQGLSLSLGRAALIMLFSVSGGALFLLRHHRG